MHLAKEPAILLVGVGLAAFVQERGQPGGRVQLGQPARQLVLACPEPVAPLLEMLA